MSQAALFPAPKLKSKSRSLKLGDTFTIDTSTVLYNYMLACTCTELVLRYSKLDDAVSWRVHWVVYSNLYV